MSNATLAFCPITRLTTLLTPIQSRCADLHRRFCSGKKLLQETPISVKNVILPSLNFYTEMNNLLNKRNPKCLKIKMLYDEM